MGFSESEKTGESGRGESAKRDDRSVTLRKCEG
jgi:hypothetical protein